MPLVSVCVQTYNQADYIKQCLDGILMQQTNFPFEIILGEDQSTDGTRKICIAYAEKHSNIKLSLRSRDDVIHINGRATGRHNFTENLKACQGRYIALCEGDDYWTDPLKLQKQVDILEKHDDINICFNRANTLKAEQLELHPIPEEVDLKGFKYIELLQHYNFITTASVVLRKPEGFTIPNWFYKIPFGDMGLYKLASGSGLIHCIEDTMSVYRVHDRGIYSGISEIKAQQNYLSFYKIIRASLNSEERKVVDKKRLKVVRKISKLKFKKSPLKSKAYYIYHRLKLVINL